MIIGYKMNIEEIEEKIVYGMSVRTKNTNEMNPDTAKIASLWKIFIDSVDVNYKDGQKLYGVYSKYESDVNGEFDVYAAYDGFDKKLDSVKIQKGRYLVFDGSGDMPHAIIQAWGDVWKYFANEASQYQRKYTTDFEYYLSENKVKIYIAIK